MTTVQNANGLGRDAEINPGGEMAPGLLVSWVDKACKVVLGGHFAKEYNVFFSSIFDRKLALLWENVQKKCHTEKSKLTVYGVFYELGVSVAVALGVSVVLHSFWVAWPVARVLPCIYAVVLGLIYEMHLLCQKQNDFSDHVGQRSREIRKSFVQFFCEATPPTTNTEGERVVCKQRVSSGLKLSVVSAVLFFFQTPFRWLFLSVSALPLLGALEVGFVAIVCLNCIQQATEKWLVGKLMVEPDLTTD